MSIPAVIGIVCFSLVILPGDAEYYFQFPIGIIGKVYANSMLVLINSRMLVGSEEKPSTIVSAVEFAPDSAIHAPNEDVALDTEALARHFKGSHPVEI